MASLSQNSALVLSGGGALGAAHLGVLRVLEERGFAFDYLAGVSAGAIVCALIACGMRSQEIMRRLKQLSFFSLAFDFGRSRHGILGGDKIKRLLDEIFAEKTFEDLEVKLIIGATDFSSGQRHMLRSGKISDAIRASISVPVLFEPFFHPGENRWLVDGGLTQNFPLDTAIEEYRGERIIAVDVATRLPPELAISERRLFGRTRRLTAAAQRAIRIFLLNQQNHFPHDPRVIRLTPDLGGYSALDAFKIDQIAAAGERAAADMKFPPA